MALSVLPILAVSINKLGLNSLPDQAETERSEAALPVLKDTFTDDVMKILHRLDETSTDNAIEKSNTVDVSDEVEPSKNIVMKNMQDEQRALAAKNKHTPPMDPMNPFIGAPDEDTNTNSKKKQVQKLQKKNSKNLLGKTDKLRPGSKLLTSMLKDSAAAVSSSTDVQSQEEATSSQQTVTVLSSGETQFAQKFEHRQFDEPDDPKMKDMIFESRQATSPQLDPNVTDDVWYKTYYAHDANNPLEKLSFTSPFTDPTQEQIAKENEAEEAAMAKILPQVEVDEAEAASYYKDNFPTDTGNDLEYFTHHREEVDDKLGIPYNG